MQSYRLNIKVIIVAVGIFSLIVFSMVLIMFRIVDVKNVINLLIDYAYIIAPTSLLWILVDKYLWHTRLFQAMTKLANIPPDLRGRWEGTLENESAAEIQKFVIEVKQTLTTLNVFSYSSIAHSVSILPEIAISHNEDHFVLCYLWEGRMNASIKDIHHVEHFHGYTILNLHQYDKQKMLEGFYFSNRSPSQTRGGCQLMWVSDHLKKKLD